MTKMFYPFLIAQMRAACFSDILFGLVTLMFVEGGKL
jgi:hypothetical protein